MGTGQLEEWARNLADFLADDKSNDWNLELFQLEAILGEPGTWTD